jgi:hypothetical protein
MTALRSLTLRNLCAVSLVPLPSLTRLEISHCRWLVDMTSIVALTDLVELRVRSCGRAVMPPLTGLMRLKVLDIDDGTIDP